MSSRPVYPNNHVKHGVRQDLFLNITNMNLIYINFMLMREGRKLHESRH